LGAINALQPDIVVTGASIKKFNALDNEQYVQLIERLNCPVIIHEELYNPWCK
jgi:ABC-type Fe3+-hydroxamate transport system substrate-binding protein